MIYRNLFFNIMITFLCCFYSPTITAGMMPNMQDFEKEFEEANKAIEEYVASLSPEEQAAFNQSVADMTQMFENMSEDEFEKFLGEMFADESMMMEPNPFDALGSEPQEEVVEIVLNPQDKKKAESAIIMLDDLIKQSNLFMVIVNSSADLPNRINQWAKKGAISNWQTGADWITFKTELEVFIQKLYRSEEQDLTTKKYKYLLELIADEALYNNLIQLDTQLKALVPTISVPEFSIQKLSKQSKQAIKDVLTKYTESFYLLNIPKALDDLFMKYAPEEEKIRLAEEAATRRAQELARVTRTPVAPSQAGTPESEGGYGNDNYYGGYDPYGSNYGYSNYGSPYGGGYNSNYGGYSPDYASGSESRGGPNGGGGETSGGGSAGGTGEEKEEKEEKDKKDKKIKKDNFIPNYEIERALADIKTGLADIKAAMVNEEDATKPTKLTDLVENIKNAKIDESLASVILPTIIDKKITLITEALETINKQASKLNAGDLVHYQREVTKSFDDNKKELEELRKSINTFEAKTKEELDAAEEYAKAHPDQAKSEKFDISKLSDAQRWAYFGAEDNTLIEDADRQLLETITSRVSLFDIKKNIDNIFKELDKFTTKKPRVEKKKTESSDIPAMPPVPEF